MTSIAFPGLAINNAEQLRESVSEPTPNTRIYLTYGKVESWANDAAPPTPNTSVSSVYEVWRNMIGGKRITGNDIRHVVQRNTWTSGTVYSAYDNTNANLLNETTLFFVVTSDFNVYRDCDRPIKGDKVFIKLRLGEHLYCRLIGSGDGVGIDHWVVSPRQHPKSGSAFSDSGYLIKEFHRCKKPMNCTQTVQSS